MKTSEKGEGGEPQEAKPRLHTQLVSINEAAKRLGVCRKTIENLLLRKELRRVSVLRRVMLRESDIESLIRKRMR